MSCTLRCTFDVIVELLGAPKFALSFDVPSAGDFAGIQSKASFCAARTTFFTARRAVNSSITGITSHCISEQSQWGKSQITEQLNDAGR
jgi:hypothetical protein